MKFVALKYLTIGVVTAALLTTGCGRKDEQDAEPEAETSSSDATTIKDFLPSVESSGPGDTGEVQVAEVVLPDVAAAQNIDVPDLPPEVVAQAGILIDQSVSEMQDLTLSFIDVKDLDSAIAAAPEITDKIKALRAIDEESKALGLTEEHGHKYFPQKYVTLKQMSALVHGHMQRLVYDVNVYRVVTDAWEEGQKAPLEENFLEARAQREAEEAAAAPPEEPPKPKRLREYDPRR